VEEEIIHYHVVEIESEFPKEENIISTISKNDRLLQISEKNEWIYSGISSLNYIVPYVLKFKKIGANRLTCFR
jgi:hypothetical protein